MDGLPTIQNSPQANPRKLMFLGYRSLLAFALSVLFISASQALADRTSKAATTPAIIEAAKTNSAPVTMQVTFPSIFYDRESNLFSQVLSELPKLFPKFKLNTIGRGMHSTIAYLDGLTLEGVKEVVEFFSKLDDATLAKYELDKEVQVLDPLNPEFVTIGVHSKFLALKPHKEFVAWQMNFYRLLADKAPGILKRHLSHKNLGEAAIAAESVHISLIQWGESSGLTLNEGEEAAALKRIQRLFKKAVEGYVKKNGLLPEIRFSLSTNPLELVTAPPSIQTPPIPIVAMKEGRGKAPLISSIGRWSVTDEATGFRELLEFDIESFMRGDADAIEVLDASEEWIKSGKHFEAFDAAAFERLIPEKLRPAYERALKNLSENKRPAAVPASDSEHKDKFFVTSVTHPKLAPEKAFKVLEMARAMGLRSTKNVSVGLAVYASSVREEIKNPGDFDLLVNSLVHVGSGAKTFKAAEDQAVRFFVKEVIEQIVDAAKLGGVAITELRVGSDASMGLPIKDVITGLEANPYLSEEDILSGSFVDKTGREWTLEQLFALGDFSKSKIDVFSGGKRKPFSLQFLLAFEWRGDTYFVQRNALKGVPPLLRTAVYDGPESFAIAASMSRAHIYSAIQKGAVVPRAIRDLVKSAFGHEKIGPSRALVNIEPMWNAKFIKKFYNFMILMRQGGMKLDEIFLKDTEKVMRNQGSWVDGLAFELVVEKLIHAVNKPELALINALKRNVNDYNEYNERNQRFRKDQWITRAEETEALLNELNEYIADQKFSEDPKVAEFLKQLRIFETHFDKMMEMRPSVGERYFHREELHDVLNEFEHQLTLLEGTVISKELNFADKKFIRTLSAYAPHFYIAYLMSRSLPADEKLIWDLRLMGIEPTAENIREMVDLSVRVGDLSHQDLAKRQGILFELLGKKKHCEELLLGGEVSASMGE